jgi:hypothetical protein
VLTGQCQEVTCGSIDSDLPGPCLHPLPPGHKRSVTHVSINATKPVNHNFAPVGTGSVCSRALAGASPGTERSRQVFWLLSHADYLGVVAPTECGWHYLTPVVPDQCHQHHQRHPHLNLQNLWAECWACQRGPCRSQSCGKSLLDWEESSV